MAFSVRNINRLADLAATITAIFVETDDRGPHPGGDQLRVALAGRNAVIFDNHQRRGDGLATLTRFRLARLDKSLDATFEFAGSGGIALSSRHAGDHLI